MKQKTIQILSIALFVCLLVGGIYELLYYLGVPVHTETLVSDDAAKSITSACTQGDFLCRGAMTLLPFITHTISRWFISLEGGSFLSTFFWYIAWSAILYGAFLFWRWLRSGSTWLRLTIRPWHVLLVFIGSLWLIFTTLSHTTVGDMAINLIVEPREGVYQNIGDEALKALQANFSTLQDAGCLYPVRESTADTVGIYDLKDICIQASFVRLVLSEVAVIGVFIFELLVLGSALLALLGLRPKRPQIEVAMSIGLGVLGMIALLWLIAIAGIYTANAGWVLVVLLPVVFYRYSLRWLQRLWMTEWTVECRWYDVSVLLAWLLLSYLAFNFLTVVRPFPIGWDDLGSYLNRPRLLVSYEHFVFLMSTFQWEYLTSLGFLLFGYDSTFGATSAMMINWTAGLFAALSVFIFANTYLGKRRGFLAALLYYTLPLVGHFSFADMKIDNAVFTMGTLATLALFLAILPPEDDGGEVEDRPHSFSADAWRWVLVAGVFAGLAFSMKVTAIMVIMGLLSVLFGVTLSWPAFVAAALIAASLYSHGDTLNISNVIQRITGHSSVLAGHAFTIGCALIAVTLIAFLVLRRKGWRSFVFSGGCFVAGMCVSVGPWLAYNNIASHNVIPTLSLSAPNSLGLIINFQGPATPDRFGAPVRGLSDDLKLDMTNPACTSTGTTEELDRYWGFGTGLSHYLTLPWRTVMNIDSAGYYVTTIPALLLFPFLLFLPYFWTKRARWLRYLFAGTVFLIVQWMFLANGIPWYGVGMFLGLVIGLEALVAKAPDALNRILTATLLSLSLAICFGMRYWEFDQQRNLLEYPMGKVSSEALTARTIPWYDTIRQIVVDRHTTVPDRPYLYRIGTFIPYFIPKNLEIIGRTDHQLDSFNCLNEERNPELTLRRLEALGFNSIVFDTNTATIESDPNGSLHKKVQAFLDFINTPGLHVKILISDLNAGLAFILLE